jgi:hypothetical protein
MNLLRKPKKLLIMLIAMALSSCAGNIYDGESLIMAIPKGCERQYVNYYKCEMSKTLLDKIFFKKCLAEPCDK